MLRLHAAWHKTGCGAAVLLLQRCNMCCVYLFRVAGVSCWYLNAVFVLHGAIARARAEPQTKRCKANALMHPLRSVDPQHITAYTHTVAVRICQDSCAASCFEPRKRVHVDFQLIIQPQIVKVLHSLDIPATLILRELIWGQRTSAVKFDSSHSHTELTTLTCSSAKKPKENGRSMNTLQTRVPGAENLRVACTLCSLICCDSGTGRTESTRLLVQCPQQLRK